jgi:hypothetical protein
MSTRSPSDLTQFMANYRQDAIFELVPLNGRWIYDPSNPGEGGKHRRPARQRHGLPGSASLLQYYGRHFTVVD